MRNCSSFASDRRGDLWRGPATTGDEGGPPTRERTLNRGPATARALGAIVEKSCKRKREGPRDPASMGVTRSRRHSKRAGGVLPLLLRAPPARGPAPPTLHSPLRSDAMSVLLSVVHFDPARTLQNFWSATTANCSATGKFPAICSAAWDPLALKSPFELINACLFREHWRTPPLAASRQKLGTARSAGDKKKTPPSSW